MRKTSFSDVKHIYGQRPEWSHKGDFGHVLVVGGSHIYTGAPYLAAAAALRAGADIAIVAAPHRAADSTARRSPDIITVSLNGDYLVRKHLKEIMKIKHSVAVIGNGLGTEKETKRAVNEFLKKSRTPVVVDADALKMISRESIKENFILTPHTGEFHEMSKIKFSDSSSISERVKAAKNFAADFGCVVLLKGHVDIITDGNEVIENYTGNPYMTKGGTGDILAGVCAALLCRANPLDAAACAAYITGRAGDLAAKILGESLTASDVLEEIKNVLKR